MNGRIRIAKNGAVPMAAAISLFLLCVLPAWASAFCFDEAGNQYGINPGLLQSIARVESSMNPKAIHRNHDGTTDMGLMQVNSTWIPSLKLSETDLTSNPCYNVKAGARILRSCIDTWGYSWQAVGCYHAVGKGRQVAYSWKIYRELKRDGKRTAALKPQDETSPEKRRINSSLHFKVRNVDESEPGMTP